MAITLSSELQFPRALPDAYNVMLDFGTLTLGLYAVDGVSASDISDLFRYLLLLNLISKDGYTFEYDSTADKIKVFLAGLEVASGTNLSTLLGSVQYLAIGFKT
jgi:hypothetical protein